MKFSVELNGMEVRSCGKHLLQNNMHDTAEIIKWEHPSDEVAELFCYVLAYWVKDGEGYNLHFVGDRPFGKDIPRDSFMFLASEGQKMLNKEYLCLEAKEWLKVAEEYLENIKIKEQIKNDIDENYMNEVYKEIV